MLCVRIAVAAVDQIKVSTTRISSTITRNTMRPSCVVVPLFLITSKI